MKEYHIEKKHPEKLSSSENSKNKNTIGEILKNYRNLKKISVNTVSEYLAKNDYMVAPKTIYGWENGHSEPNAMILMLLCSLYGIDDVLNAFGFHESKHDDLHLTTHEERLILQYRQNPDIQPVIDKLLDILE